MPWELHKIDPVKWEAFEHTLPHTCEFTIQRRADGIGQEWDVEIEDEKLGGWE